MFVDLKKYAYSIISNSLFLNKMNQDTLFELTRRSVPIIKNDTPHLSWRNNVIIVRTSKRLYFIEFTYNLECFDRKMDFIETSIPCPHDSPATDVLNNSKFLREEMRNVDYTEMIVNSSFWPHNQSLTQEMTSFSLIKWSPPNFFNNFPVLAILNNIGGVEIFGQHQYEWKSILNLSPCVKNALQYKKLPQNFEELQESVNILETSAICWAQELNEDNSCYFVTAQKNGAVLFWLIHNTKKTITLQGNIQTELLEINRMLWIPKTSKSFWLICADVLGQIFAFDMQEKNDHITLVQSYPLWTHKDRMLTLNLNYFKTNNHIIFICSKHRHLLIQAIDENGTVVSQFLKNINDYRITDIACMLSTFYLSTVNVKVYRINIQFLSNKLQVDVKPLDLKDQYVNCDLHSLKFSMNNVFCAFSIVDRRVLVRKEPQVMEIIFLSTNKKLESILPMLIDNPTRKLTHHWDCIELLRFEMIKLKIIPKYDFVKLYNEACHDIYKLKIYFILMTFFSTLKKILRVVSDITLPETSLELLKEKILYLHAQSIFNNLCTKYKKHRQLNDFDVESLYGSKNYLEYFSKKHKLSIELDANVLSAVKNNNEYICQSCDKKLEGFSCSEGHINIFCVVSFTPILGVDYLVCKGCNATARTDISDKDYLCVFCDLHFVTPE